VPTHTTKGQYNTSIAGWSFAIADALVQYGVDAHDIFSLNGIDLEAV